MMRKPRITRLSGPLLSCAILSLSWTAATATVAKPLLGTNFHGGEDPPGTPRPATYDYSWSGHFAGEGDV